VEGISKDVGVKNVLKELKTRLACGGTLKDGVIELQGNHMDKVKSILVKLGFKEEQIEVD
jgi:translation initiation factor 1